MKLFIRIEELDMMEGTDTNLKELIDAKIRLNLEIEKE